MKYELASNNDQPTKEDPVLVRLIKREGSVYLQVCKFNSAVWKNVVSLDTWGVANLHDAKVGYGYAESRDLKHYIDN